MTKTYLTTIDRCVNCHDVGAMCHNLYYEPLRTCCIKVVNVMDEFSTFIIITLIVSLIGPLLCAGVVWCTCTHRKNIGCESDQALLRYGVQALLRDRILASCKFYRKLGYSTYNARTNITQLYEAYIALSGSSIELNEYSAFMKLPHSPDDRE